MHQTNLPKFTHVERSLAWSWPTFYRRATFTGTGNARRPIARTIANPIEQTSGKRRASGWGNVRPTCDGAGRTFRPGRVRCAHWGWERTAREQPGTEERGWLRVGREWERKYERDSASTRQVEKRRARAAKRRKLKLGLPGFEIRITDARPPALSLCTLCTQSLTVLNSVLKLLLSGTKISSIGVCIAQLCWKIRELRYELKSSIFRLNFV